VDGADRRVEHQHKAQRTMDIAKKNIVSISLGVVMVLAFAASFFPLAGKVKELEDKVEQSQDQHSAVASLLKKGRNKPILRPGAAAEALGMFPSETVIKQGQAAAAHLAAESQEMFQTAVNMNRKTVLVENALPKPKSTEDTVFLKAYQDYFTQRDGGYQQWFQALNSTTGATADAVKQALAREEALIRKDEQRVGDEVFNAAEIQARLAKRKAQVPNELRSRLAQEHTIYVNGDTFMRDTNLLGLQPGERLKPEEMWWAQVGIWLQEEIVVAVAHVNRDATSIADAPIKHLLKVSFPSQFTISGPANAGGPRGSLPRIYTVSPTGRVSNGMYDVIQFDMNIVAEVAKIPFVVKGLADSRFMTVLEMDVESGDSAALAAAGYLYGPEPVARINMKCEALFMREWTVPFMPSGIKQQLGLEAAPAAAAAPRR
jgi:hypothetical protein